MSINIAKVKASITIKYDLPPMPAPDDQSLAAQYRRQQQEEWEYTQEYRLKKFGPHELWKDKEKPYDYYWWAPIPDREYSRIGFNENGELDIIPTGTRGAGRPNYGNTRPVYDGDTSWRGGRR